MAVASVTAVFYALKNLELETLRTGDRISGASNGTGFSHSGKDSKPEGDDPKPKRSVEGHGFSRAESRA